MMNLSMFVMILVFSLTQIKIRSGIWLSCNDCEFNVAVLGYCVEFMRFDTEPYIGPLSVCDDKYLGKSRYGTQFLLDIFLYCSGCNDRKLNNNFVEVKASLYVVDKIASPVALIVEIDPPSEIDVIYEFIVDHTREQVLSIFKLAVI